MYQRVLALALATVLTSPAPAQCVVRVERLSSETPRLHISRAGEAASRLIRDAVQCDLAAARDSARVRFHLAYARLGMAGGVGESDPDGVSWPTVGIVASISSGVSLGIGPLRALLAPALTWGSNRPFFVYPSADTTRSVFASPWYAGQYSADLPLRFGADRILLLEPGATSAWVTLPVRQARIEAGWSASQQAFGPGRRGSLIVGASAPGVPRVFVRSGRPIATPLGRWSVTAFKGILTESPFFDTVASNDNRGLVAGALSWQPNRSNRISLGVATATMVAHLADTSGGKPHETMSSVFGSVADADGGLRIWFELARRGPPGLRELLRSPQEGVVYVLGLESITDVTNGSLLLSAEVANLEQPIDIRENGPQDLYTSRRVPQGWTQRGRPLGHFVGPGGQSQWVSVSRIYPRWTFGGFVERSRWNEDAFLRQFLPYPARHDVSLRAGAQVSRLALGREVSVEASLGKRLNYLFQNTQHISGFRTVDIATPRLVLTVRPVERE